MMQISARISFPLAMTLLVGLVACTETPAPRARRQSYAGLERRSIAALAPQQVARLLAGEGLGYALAAELNHYPGPRHVLELRHQLDLTVKQEQTISDIRRAMTEKAKILGRRLVVLEMKLDEHFESGTITRRGLARLTRQIAEVQGRLRETHLQAHLEVQKILSRKQISLYDAARGYSSAHPSSRRHRGHTAP